MAFPLNDKGDILLSFCFFSHQIIIFSSKSLVLREKIILFAKFSLERICGLPLMQMPF